MLDRLSSSITYIVIGREFSINDLAIQYIQKKEEQICQSVYETTTETAKLTSVVWGKDGKVAKFVDSWDDDQLKEKQGRLQSCEA